MKDMRVAERCLRPFANSQWSTLRHAKTVNRSYIPHVSIFQYIVETNKQTNKKKKREKKEKEKKGREEKKKRDEIKGRIEKRREREREREEKRRENDRRRDVFEAMRRPANRAADARTIRKT